MIISVHQPQYIPWLGYFDKIKNSDTFVFLDNVQYKKREFQNRNKIKTKTGPLWLTIPVITKDRYYQKISEVEINNTDDWKKNHWQSIVHNYAHAKHFEKFKESFEDIYKTDWKKLIDINVKTVQVLLDILEIKTKIVFESELDISSTSTQRIVDICKALNADTYLSGAGGKDYMDEILFKNNNISLAYQEYHHPTYPQIHNPFEPYMSAIDLIFNCGRESKDILSGGKKS